MIPTRRSKNRAEKQVSASMRQLEEQIIYAKGENGDYIATCSEYYDKVFGSDIRYNQFLFGNGQSKVICPFHDDIAPSLGIVKDKDGVEVFNCFGCGAKGTVVTMHEKTCSLKNAGGDKISHLRDLASAFGIDLKMTVSESEIYSKMSANIDYGVSLGYNLNSHRKNVREIRNKLDILNLDDIKKAWNILTNAMIGGDVGD